MEVVGWVLVPLLAGAVLGGWLARRAYMRGAREIEAYLKGWEVGVEEGQQATARDAERRRRSPWNPVFQRLDEHRQAFLALRALSQVTTRRLQKLIDALTEGVLLFDSEGRLLFVNGKLRELVGQAAPGSDPPAADDPRVLREVEAALAERSNLRDVVRRSLAGDLGSSGEAVMVRTGDVERRFLATAHLIQPTARGGSDLLLLLTDVEVLEDVRRNAGRRLALEHVRLAAELMAHRLRNPLNSVVLVLELLRRESARAGVQRLEKHLNTIQEEVGRIDGILHRYLVVVRTEERRVETVDLVQVVEMVAELLYPLARDARIRVRQELEVASAPVTGDVVEVTRAVLGPALAGVRASEPGSELKLRLDSDRREHLLLLEAPGSPPDAVQLAVAEDLAARNGGSLVREENGPAMRLVYRFTADSRTA